jgi:predicted aminopeptidase
VTRLAALAAVVATGCGVYPQYLAQAAYGELDMLTRARPVADVVRDPDTPLRTAMILAELPDIAASGRSYGLKITRNYQKFTQINKPALVWFVGASDPLAFKPIQRCFPIAGCFPGLGWWDEDEAVANKLALERQGYDAWVRPAAAFSTGGWFPDPVVSTMLGGGDDALPEFANVILHESVHATVFVTDEQFFNESFASYVADTLVDTWILVRFGRGSPEHLAWTLGQAVYLARTARMLDVYKQLKALYDSNLPRDQKLAKKAAIIDEVVADLRIRKRPNNASLNEVKLYNGGAAAILEAHRACGDLRSLVQAAKTLTRADFQKTLQDDLHPIGELLGKRCREKK